MSRQVVSFIKSAVRIGGYVMLAVAADYVTDLSLRGGEWLYYASFVLIISELIGVAEEIGH